MSDFEIYIDNELEFNNIKFKRVTLNINKEKTSLITINQISQLIKYSVKRINETINRNIKDFIDYEDVIDLIENKELHYNILKSIGYSKQSIGNSKNIYALTHSGFLKYLQIADIDIDYSDFERLYFGESKLVCTTIRYEKNFKNLLNKTFDGIANFKTQENFNNKYRIDFYEPNFKLAVEYDEECHKHRKQEDEIRQTIIEKKLGCTFIRVKKNEELEGINKIFKYILEFNMLNQTKSVSL